MSTGPSVNSPFAKVTSSGQLICIACSQNVKSSKVWTAHVNGRHHRERVLVLKSHLNKSGKRPASSDDKPSPSNYSLNNGPSLKRTKRLVKPVLEDVNQPDILPADFFDSKAKSENSPDVNEQTNVEWNERTDNANDEPKIVQTPWEKESKERKTAIVPQEPKPNTAEALPEGFFDDPNVDKKVRKVDNKDPLDAEWLRFQKEVQQAEQQAETVVDEDEEQTNLEKTIEEIDNQIMEWSRVSNLEKRKEQLIPNSLSTETTELNGDDERMSDESSSDTDFDMILDWRSKNI